MNKLICVRRSFRFVVDRAMRHYLCMVIGFMLSPVGAAQAAVIDDIKADMGLNEAPLMKITSNAAWAKSAIIKMGTAPRGDATPNWWKPANPELKSAEPWTAIVPWFVIYPGAGHTATNVRVKVYGINIFILQKSTNKWKRIDTGDGKPGWSANYGFNMGTKVSLATPRVEPDEQLSYKLNKEFNPVHGAQAGYDLSANGIYPADIGAVFVYAKTQLIPDNPDGVDDRAAARILFSIGADYYPTVKTSLADLAPMKSYPGIGGSRYGLVKTEPRTHYFSTIDPPGPLSRKLSDYTSAGNPVALPVKLFEANMPPLP